MNIINNNILLESRPGEKWEREVDIMMKEGASARAQSMPNPQGLRPLSGLDLSPKVNPKHPRTRNHEQNGRERESLENHREIKENSYEKNGEQFQNSRFAIK